MTSYSSKVLMMAKQPTAFAPVLMSLAALATVVFALLLGVARDPDEGAAAHLFQLLIAGQAPLLAAFLWRWLRHDPRAALTVLTLQVLAMGPALAIVWTLHL